MEGSFSRGIMNEKKEMSDSFWNWIDLHEVISQKILLKNYSPIQKLFATL